MCEIVRFNPVIFSALVKTPFEKPTICCYTNPIQANSTLFDNISRTVLANSLLDTIATIKLCHKSSTLVLYSEASLG
jgi:hypothetical protein